MLRLWGAGTARTMRPHWMLQELALPYEREPIGPRTGQTQAPDFVTLNVKEKVPVLQDGDLVLTESAAIVTYLGQRYGASNVLVPSDVEQRARYDEWISYVLMELDAHTLYVIRKHRDLRSIYGDAPAAIEAATAGFYKQVRFAEQQLAQHSYAMGGAFSGADIILGTTLDWAHAYGLVLSAPLASYRQRLHRRDAFGRAVDANRVAAQ